jgi:DNA-binding SARP family transcriptional activator
MRFRVLGTLEVRSRDDRPRRLGAAKQRTLLGVLLLNANRPVALDRLVDALWPNGSPRTALVALRTYISALRQALGLGEDPGRPRLATVPGGYQMNCTSGDLDLLAFEDLVAQGRQARVAGNSTRAAERLRRALELWRGRPFEDVALAPDIRIELIRLEERKLVAQEAWLDTQLELGHHEDVLAELGGLVAENPLREKLWAQRIRALHRAGRRAEALRAYGDLRRHLVSELGVEPSPALQQLHVRILTGQEDSPSRGSAPEAPAAPRQLPSGVGGFTGRAVELAQLVRPEPPAVIAIDGMAGIGKTALAVRAAHRLADTHPDGHLVVDLHGHTQGMEPDAPAHVLDRMLRVLGIPGSAVPAGLEARAALWRTRLAGRKVLVVLDNAHSEAQVEPLLPGARGCTVLITSRRRLVGLDDVRSISLDVLPPADAITLFTRTTTPDLLAAQPPDLVAEIVELCGRLPLAIRIAAARLRHRPGWTLPYLAERLRYRHDLSELTAGQRSMSAAIDLSYQDLTPDQQRMFLVLGLHPGADIDTYAAAALDHIAVPLADRLLEDLLDANLLQQDVPGRYRFHDLVRAHAATICAERETEAEQRKVLIRLFDFYAHTASTATNLLYPNEGRLDPLPSPTPIPPFADGAGAARWLDAESANLVTTASYAARHGWVGHTVGMSAVLRRHLRTRLPARPER